MLNGRAVQRAIERAEAVAFAAVGRPVAGREDDAPETSAWFCPAHEPERKPSGLTATFAEAARITDRPRTADEALVLTHWAERQSGGERGRGNRFRS